MSAIIASCIHGSAQGGRRLDRATIDRFLPHEPAVLLSLTRRSLLDIEPMSETQAVIDAFFVSLRTLRRAIETYFFDASKFGRSALKSSTPGRWLWLPTGDATKR